MRKTDLNRWCSFYERTCELVLKEQTEAEKEKQQLQELFYLFYESDSFCDLKPMEFAIVMLLASVSLKGSVNEAVQSICQRFSARDLTFQIAVTIVSAFVDEKDVRWECMFDADGAFLRHFVEVNDSKPKSVNSAIRLQEHVISVLQGKYISVQKAGFCMDYIVDSSDFTMCGREREMDWLKEIYVKVFLADKPGVIHLKGEAGEGKKHAAKYLAGYFFRGILILDGKFLVNMNMEDIQEVLHLAQRVIFFDHALLYLDFNGVHNETETEKFQISRLLSILQKELKHFMIGGDFQLNEWMKSSKPIYIREWEHVSAAGQKQLWKYFAEKEQLVLDEKIDLDELVSIYDMSPRNMEAVIKMSAPFAGRVRNQMVVQKALLSDSIKKTIVAHFDKLVTKLNSPFTWEDLKVSELAKSKMQSAIQRIKYRNVVNDNYGFGKKLPYGQGVVIALYGPSGTGKTMAATVIANELNLDIYRIDLSQVSSKYIGESERNLAKIFDTAKNTNAILFFDEADSLFAKRTDVGSSNDKYANAETGFLLQKMEEYRGISILATNLMQSFDAAFKRRITYMIPLDRPTEQERLELWESVFPEEAPLAEDVRFDVFVRVADELTGSGIKAAAISAAYAAAAQNRPIMQMDIANAVNEEYMKLGHTSILYELMMGS